MNTYLNNLMTMINKSHRLKNDSVRLEYINQTIAYALFIYYSGYVTEQEFNDALSKMQLNSFTEMYNREKNDSIHDLVINNSLLNELYRKKLMLYYNYQLESKNNLKINKDIKEHFISFLKYINCYDLYCDLENKKSISYNSPVLNDSICIGNKNSSYIVINEKEGIYRYICLSHEIAHALENKILKTRRQYFDAPYTTEIMSITFNRIFLEYLKENDALSKQEVDIIKNNFEINCHRFIQWSFLITEAVKEGKFTISDYNINILLEGFNNTRSLTDHNYALGSVFSVSLLDMWRKGDRAFISDIPSMLFYLNKMSIQELINFFNKYDCFDKELSKTLSKK